VLSSLLALLVQKYKFFLLAQPALPASLRTAVADSLAAGAQQLLALLVYMPASLCSAVADCLAAGAQQFTCFTGLHARSAVAHSLAAGTHFTCFTGTKVQMLTRGGAAAADRPVSSGTQVLSCLLALLVQTYKY
jgi:type IV secretory pathway TrbL component